MKTIKIKITKKSLTTSILDKLFALGYTFRDGSKGYKFLDANYIYATERGINVFYIPSEDDKNCITTQQFLSIY